MLRTLRHTSKLTMLCISFLGTSAVLGQDAELPPQEIEEATGFADGATGSIDLPLYKMTKDAEQSGVALGDTLEVQEGSGDFSEFDFDAMRDKALNNPRVRALLGVIEPDPTTQAGQGNLDSRYADAGILMLASFSMPDLSLQQMMSEAKQYGVPVVFRGFVNNSVFETQTALERVFGSLENAPGFGIDPTVFTRFDIQSVPVIIGVDRDLELCETAGCEGDPVPNHDRVSGNVPLSFALELMAERGDVANAEALRILQGGQQ